MPFRFRHVAALCFLIIALLPKAVSAHAVLLGTEPDADAVLAEPPAVVVLRFNEPVRPVLIRVLDGTGEILADEGAARSLDDRVEISVPEQLQQGGFIVSWRVISADSHPIGGSFRFAVGAEPDEWRGAAYQDAAAEAVRWWTIVNAAARVVFLIALLSSAGAIWFFAFVAREEKAPAAAAARLATFAVSTAAVAGLLTIVLRGGLLLAASPRELFGSTLWQSGLAIPMGQAALAAVAALLVALGALLLRARGGMAALASVAALAAVFSLALAGHAATAEPRFITAPALAAHAAVAAFWLGSLPPLLVAIRRLPGENAALVLKRFSRIAVLMVAVLVIAGVALVVVQVQRVEAFWETRYGLILGAKLILVAGLLLLAIQNKRALTPSLAAGDPDVGRKLARNIVAEIAAIAAIVCLTAALGFTTPPRALLAAGMEGHEHDASHRHAGDDAMHGQPTIEHTVNAEGMNVTIRVSPGRAGANAVRVFIRDTAGMPLEPLEVSVRFSSPELGIEPVERKLRRREDYYWVETSDMAVAGNWQVRFDVLVSDFEKRTFEIETQIW